MALLKTELKPEDVWYIGAIDMSFEGTEGVITVRSWKELEQLMNL